MIIFFYKKRGEISFRVLVVTLILSFCLSLASGYFNNQSSSGFAEYVPEPSKLIPLSQPFSPAMLRGVTVNPKDPFQFDFLLDSGQETLTNERLIRESKRLIKYFYGALTVPSEDLWVNLSPYESERIVPTELGSTELGKGLLEQDYILKQLLASVTHPESPLGMKFWQKVYQRAYSLYGTSDIPINTFDKIWIVPDRAVIYEDGNKAYIKESNLKVMLEEDYLALEKNRNNPDKALNSIGVDKINQISKVSSDIMRDIVLPEIERDINTGENFAVLRQIYNSLILAVWFKQKLKTHILNQVYSDRNKIKGVDINDRNVKDKIYAYYLEAFKKGAYDLIRNDYDPVTDRKIKRRYFSGGFDGSKVLDVISGSPFPKGGISSEGKVIALSVRTYPALTGMGVGGGSESGGSDSSFGVGGGAVKKIDPIEDQIRRQQLKKRLSFSALLENVLSHVVYLLRRSPAFFLAEHLTDKNSPKTANDYTAAELNPYDSSTYHQTVHQAISSGLPSDLDKNFENYRDHDGQVVLPVKDLFKNTGLIAHIGLGQVYDEPVIYIDSQFNGQDREDIKAHERYEIERWQWLRSGLGLNYQQMRNWIRDNSNYTGSGTAQRLAAKWHVQAPSVRHIYLRIQGDKVQSASMQATVASVEDVYDDSPDVVLAAGFSSAIDMDPETLEILDLTIEEVLKEKQAQSGREVFNSGPLVSIIFEQDIQRHSSEFSDRLSQYIPYLNDRYSNQYYFTNLANYLDYISERLFKDSYDSELIPTSYHLTWGDFKRHIRREIIFFGDNSRKAVERILFLLGVDPYGVNSNEIESRKAYLQRVIERWHIFGPIKSLALGEFVFVESGKDKGVYLKVKVPLKGQRLARTDETADQERELVFKISVLNNAIVKPGNKADFENSQHWHNILNSVRYAMFNPLPNDVVMRAPHGRMYHHTFSVNSSLQDHRVVFRPILYDNEDTDSGVAGEIVITGIATHFNNHEGLYKEPLLAAVSSAESIENGTLVGADGKVIARLRGLMEDSPLSSLETLQAVAEAIDRGNISLIRDKSVQANLGIIQNDDQQKENELIELDVFSSLVQRAMSQGEWIGNYDSRIFSRLETLGGRGTRTSFEVYSMDKGGFPQGVTTAWGFIRGSFVFVVSSDVAGNKEDLDQALKNAVNQIRNMVQMVSSGNIGAVESALRESLDSLYGKEVPFNEEIKSLLIRSRIISSDVAELLEVHIVADEELNALGLNDAAYSVDSKIIVRRSVYEDGVAINNGRLTDYSKVLIHESVARHLAFYQNAASGEGSVHHWAARSIEQQMELSVLLEYRDSLSSKEEKEEVSKEIRQLYVRHNQQLEKMELDIIGLDTENKRQHSEDYAMSGSLGTFNRGELSLRKKNVQELLQGYTRSASRTEAEKHIRELIFRLGGIDNLKATEALRTIVTRPRVNRQDNEILLAVEALSFAAGKGNSVAQSQLRTIVQMHLANLIISGIVSGFFSTDSGHFADGFLSSTVMPKLLSMLADQGSMGADVFTPVTQLISLVLQSPERFNQDNSFDKEKIESLFVRRLISADAILSTPDLSIEEYRASANTVNAIGDYFPYLIIQDYNAARVGYALGPYASQNGLASWRFFDNAHFQEVTSGLTAIERHSIASAAYHFLRQHGKSTVVDGNLSVAVDVIMMQRTSNSLLSIRPFSSTRKTINILHNEDSFDVSMVEEIERQASSQTGEPLIESFKGAEQKYNALNSVSQSTGELTVFFVGHGGPNHSWLSGGEPETAVSDRMKHPYAISFEEMGNSLIERGDIGKVVILLESCYSYNFAVNLYNYLKQHGAKEFPAIVTASSYNQLSWTILFVKSISEFVRRNNDFKLGDAFEIEQYMYQDQDLSVFLPTSKSIENQVANLVDAEDGQDAFIFDDQTVELYFPGLILAATETGVREETEIRYPPLAVVQSGFIGSDGRVEISDLEKIGVASDRVIDAYNRKEFMLPVTVANGHVVLRDAVLQIGDITVTIKVNNTVEGFAGVSADHSVVYVNITDIDDLLFSSQLSDEEKETAVKRILLHDVTESYALQSRYRRPEAHQAAMMAESMMPGQSQRIRDALGDILK
ncbi:MAG: hypothetical protein PHV17_00235, partial [Candidatus Omnitrophica bacterium]|nr:hypothetical protein [Candidatus Omnitrophota bacterium]